MPKNTSILLGDYFDNFISSQNNHLIILMCFFDNFISSQIKSGRFSSASEVIRTALRMFEEEESKKSELIKELKKGEKSGFVKDFDRASFLNNLDKKYPDNEL